MIYLIHYTNGLKHIETYKIKKKKQNPILQMLEKIHFGKTISFPRISLTVSVSKWLILKLHAKYKSTKKKDAKNKERIEMQNH